jgi:hypothetical protein
VTARIFAIGFGMLATVTASATAGGIRSATSTAVVGVRRRTVRAGAKSELSSIGSLLS